ncbi:MAG TPA: hypothetical protein VEB43_05045 [Anaeromyxobacter sp.]|nr:hypothetical protein [Anaeromyxobacter sp.]
MSGADVAQPGFTSDTRAVTALVAANTPETHPEISATRDTSTSSRV